MPGCFFADCSVFSVHNSRTSVYPLTSRARAPPRMPQPTAQQKHDILIHCQSRCSSDSDVSIAAAHGVTATRKTLFNWRKQWNGAPESLERKKTAGRPPLLTPSEVSQHIRAPILAANRAQRAIHYPEVQHQVQTKTGKKITLRTLQRYGKEKCLIKEKTVHKRTRAECECRHTECVACACVLRVCAADLCLQCLLLPVKRSQTCAANSSANTPDTSSSSMRLHSDSVSLHCARSFSRASNHTWSRRRLLPTLLDST